MIGLRSAGIHAPASVSPKKAGAVHEKAISLGAFIFPDPGGPVAGADDRPKQPRFDYNIISGRDRFRETGMEP